MKELGLTVAELAAKAGVDPGTVRGLITGRRWLREDTRERITTALGWPRGEIARRVWTGQIAIEQASTEDLIHELCRRFDVNG